MGIKSRSPWQAPAGQWLTKYSVFTFWHTSLAMIHGLQSLKVHISSLLSAFSLQISQYGSKWPPPPYRLKGYYYSKSGSPRNWGCSKYLDLLRSEKSNHISHQNWSFTLINTLRVAYITVCRRVTGWRGKLRTVGQLRTVFLIYDFSRFVSSFGLKICIVDRKTLKKTHANFYAKMMNMWGKMKSWKVSEVTPLCPKLPPFTVCFEP